MNDFESRRIARRDGASDTDPFEERPTSEAAPEWFEIKSTSLAQFVNVCSAHLGRRYDREFRDQLYTMGHTSGRTNVRSGGVTYTGPMMLDLYRTARREWHNEPIS